jgi:hypothetical protein
MEATKSDLKYLTEKRFVVFFPPEKIVWEGSTYESRQDAINAVNEFWGTTHAWKHLAEKGWKIRQASLTIKL